MSDQKVSEFITIHPAANVVADLDALPLDAVVRSSTGSVYEKVCQHDEEEWPFWESIGDQRSYAACAIALPAAVLYIPDEATQ